MNQSAVALEKFINDFALRQPGGVIYFHAIIHLLINGNLQVQGSEVHIITSDGLATVYILELDNKFFKLPDIFQAKKQAFSYIAHKCLQITGEGGDGKFTLSIFPEAQ